MKNINISIQLNTTTKKHLCPGKCSECRNRNGLPICYDIKPGEKVLFKLHGNGVKPESAEKSLDRYISNILSCKESLKNLDVSKVEKVRNSCNSKTGEIPVINQPCIITCSKYAKCAGGCAHGTCYAMNGQTAFKTSVNARIRNLIVFEKDPELYFKLALKDTFLSRFARWHDSGDIVNRRYLVGMIETAIKNPDTTYSTMTKQFDIVNDYVKENGGSIEKALPENLKIMFSGWMDLYDIEPGSKLNPYGFPTTGVYKNEK